MPAVPLERTLLRARDFADARFADAIGVDEMAAAAGYSRAHFTRAFRAAFGETPRAYLLTRRLERAAYLLRHTDWPVNEVCWAVGLQSVGSFTTSFRRSFGATPTQHRAAHPPGLHLTRVPGCVERLYGRPQHRTSGEAARDAST